ncbi:MAG: hypothetical protein WCE20_07465 [Rhizomicrobium sp.]
MFTESWKDTQKCSKVHASGSVYEYCRDRSSGKFAIKTTILGSDPLASGALNPSILTSQTSVFDISLAPPGGAGSGSGSSRGSNAGSSPGSGPYSTGYYLISPISTANGWTIKGNSKKATAKLKLYRPDCNKPKFNYETIELTITNKPELEVSISATTGSDGCDTENWFADSIDAQTFNGESNPSINQPNSLFLQMDFHGIWNFNDAQNDNVSVTGKVKTKAGKSIGSSSSAPELSDVNITGKF